MTGVLLAAALASASAAPAAPVDAGRRIFLHGEPSRGIIPCAACHGLDGHGRPGTGAPLIAGLGARGVRLDLGVLASGGGGDPVMTREAQHLTPADQAAVAAYVATLR